MKKVSHHLRSLVALLALAVLAGGCATCRETARTESNIKRYTDVWNEIVNHHMLELFNDKNFTPDVVMHVSPSDLTGIPAARDYYANFLTGFSEIEFTVKDAFGHGDKLVKYWNFKGKHTGDFFGMPATGRNVNIDGVTLVRMSGKRIAEERDFFDTQEFNNQLGIKPPATK